MTIFGVDLSDFNAVTTAQVRNFRAAGISFLTHKSVETTPGGNVQHVRLKAVLEAAKAGGVPFLGAYMVPRTGLSAAAQGQAHIAYLDAQVPWWRTFPGFFNQVDLEVWDYDNVAASVGNGIFDWLKVNGAGKPVVLYASKGQYGGSSMRTPRWNANYPGASVADFKAKYAAVGGDNGAGWTSYGNPAALPLLWQYCDNAVVAGSPPIDCNAYRGTEAQFAAALGFSAGTTPPAGGTQTGDKKVSYFVRVSDGPQTGAVLVSDGVTYSHLLTVAAAQAAMQRAGKTYGQWDAQPTQAQIDAGEFGTSATRSVDVAALASAIVAQLPASADATAIEAAVKAALVATTLHFTPAA